MSSNIRVGVNGFGHLGQRVASAIEAQPDMQLVGIADVASSDRIKLAAESGLPTYASAPEHGTLHAAGIPVSGALDDLLALIDVVADCTPDGIGATYLENYRAAGVKAVFQGGEKHDVAGHSFVAQANYATALRRDATRVLSPAATAAVRVLVALNQDGLLSKARGVIMQAAERPRGDRVGFAPKLHTDPRLPSLHGLDARTVAPQLDVKTMVVTSPDARCHLHYWTLELTRSVSREKVLSLLRAAPRVVFVQSSDGMAGLKNPMKMMQDLGRPTGDLWEVALWSDSLQADGREVRCTYQVLDEAVVPEHIDAIRALSGTVTSARESISLTNEALGARHDLRRGPIRIVKA